MLLQAGQTLQSHSTSSDDYFCNAVVCLVEYNDTGALGFLINRPFSRTLNELIEFSHLPSIPLYEGGPVDQDHLYFFHRRPDLIEGGEKIEPGFYFGGNFKQAAEAIKQGTLTSNDIYILVGYCGWYKGDLEREIEAKEWSFIRYPLFS